MAQAPIERGSVVQTGNGRHRVIFRRGNFRFAKTLRHIAAGEKTTLKTAMTECAGWVRDGAKGLVRVLTGRLRDAIEARVDANGLAARIGIFRSSIRAGILHHNAEEFGTRFHLGHPYLWPAMEHNRGRIKQRLIGAIREILQGAGRG